MVSSSSPPINFDVAIQKLMKEERGYLLSVLIGTLHDLELAEDALHDAIEAALVDWRKNGLPKSPKAWILKVAKRKAIDRLRRDKIAISKKDEIQFQLEQDNEPTEDEYAVPDERLRLIFTCCHPALDNKISVALTLQMLGGLSTVEIAKAFLVNKEAMAQRLVRGKRKIKQKAIPYTIPEKEIFKERLEAVLKVLYLIFNEGYSASSGKNHIRSELTNEAIRLARILLLLCPQEAEVRALLALMLLHDSRRKSRFSKKGDFITLEDQDRKLWNFDLINEGMSLVESALKKGPVGSYQIQASISAIHAQADTYQETDWQEIVLLYDTLNILTPSPVIILNRTVAASYIIPIEDCLADLDKLEKEFVNYQPFYAAKADFYARSGSLYNAKLYYQKAIKLSGNDSEKKFLTGKIEAIKSLQSG